MKKLSPEIRRVLIKLEVLQRKLFKIERYSLAVLLAGFALTLLTSCATDPVVNAEKTTAVANDTFDAFVHLERNNEAYLKTVSPQIHNYANIVRRNGVQWLQSARALTIAYENNRTSQNKANLDTALAVLNTAIVQSQQYIVQINAQVAKPASP